jgi:hypothetical protein
MYYIVCRYWTEVYNPGYWVGLARLAAPGKFGTLDTWGNAQPGLPALLAAINMDPLGDHLAYNGVMVLVLSLSLSLSTYLSM